MAKAKRTPTQEAYGNASGLLVAALEAVPFEHHPDQPFHGGGPQPKVDAARYVEAVIWAASRVIPYVDADDRAEFDRRVGLAKRQLELGRMDKTLVPSLLEGRRWQLEQGAAQDRGVDLSRGAQLDQSADLRGCRSPCDASALGLDPQEAGRGGGGQFLVDVEDLGVHLEGAQDNVSDTAFIDLWAKQKKRRLPFRFGYVDRDKQAHLVVTKPMK